MKKAALKHLRIKETLTHMFSFEYCEIFKNTYFEEYLLNIWFLKKLQNRTICNSLAKDLFMLHKKFNQEDLAT